MEITFDLREFLLKTKAAILKPRDLYKKVAKEKNWKDSLAYSVAISVVAAILGVIQAFVFFPALKGILPAQFQELGTPTILEALPAFLFSTIIIVLLSFVWAWFMHQWLRLWKVKGDFWDSYKAYVYSRAPLSILGWIPYIGAFAGLYSLYVLAVGVSELYGISIKKALLLIVPLVVVLFGIQFIFFSLGPQ